MKTETGIPSTARKTALAAALAAAALPTLAQEQLALEEVVVTAQKREQSLQDIPGSVAACVMAFERGASVFRVHDVGEVVQALAVARAVTRSAPRSVTGPDTLR